MITLPGVALPRTGGHRVLAGRRELTKLLDSWNRTASRFLKDFRSLFPEVDLVDTGGSSSLESPAARIGRSFSMLCAAAGHRFRRLEHGACIA